MIIDALLAITMQPMAEPVRGRARYYRRVKRKRMTAPPVLAQHTLICDNDCEVPEPRRVRTIDVRPMFLDRWHELPEDWQVIVRVSR